MTSNKRKELDARKQFMENNINCNGYSVEDMYKITELPKDIITNLLKKILILNLYNILALSKYKIKFVFF